MRVIDWQATDHLPAGDRVKLKASPVPLRAGMRRAVTAGVEGADTEVCPSVCVAK
jgi:hypothetical protein